MAESAQAARSRLTCEACGVGGGCTPGGSSEVGFAGSCGSQILEALSLKQCCGSFSPLFATDFRLEPSCSHFGSVQAIPDHTAIVPATHATGSIEISDSEEATVQARVVLSVVGAQDQSLQDLVEGDYSRQWTHHRRDVFKRLETDKDKENGQSSSNSMFLYFWDDTIDGEAADRGWWFGPEVGGEAVVLRKKSNAKFPLSARP